MSNETPQVVDKRRFTDDGDIRDAILEADLRVAEAIRDTPPFQSPVKGTVWHLRPDGDYENRETGDVVPHGMFPEPSDGQDSWRVGLHHSPVAEFSPSSEPKHVPGMDFGTALKEVIKGNRVTRLEWENPETWLMMFYWGQINPNVPAGKYLSIHHANGQVSPLYANDGDMMAEDWVVVS